MGLPHNKLRLITRHLGNGVSAAAIDGGRCVETSMGQTPQEGLVMGTRAGAHVKKKLRDMQIDCRNYTHEHVIYMPDIRDWVWPF